MAPMCLPELQPVKIQGDLGKNAWFRPTSVTSGDAWIDTGGHPQPQSTHDCAVACGNIRFRNNNTNYDLDGNNRANILAHSEKVPMSQPMSRYDPVSKTCHCYDYIKSTGDASAKTSSENEDVTLGVEFFRCAPDDATGNTEKTAWVRTSPYDIASPFELKPTKLTDIPSCSLLKTVQNPSDINNRCDNNPGSVCAHGWGKFLSNPYNRDGNADNNVNCICLPNLQGQPGNCDWKDPLNCQRQQLPIWWDLYIADGTRYVSSESCLTKKDVHVRWRRGDITYVSGKRCSSYRGVLGNPCAYDGDCETNVCIYYDDSTTDPDEYNVSGYCACDPHRQTESYTCGTPPKPDA